MMTYQNPDPGYNDNQQQDDQHQQQRNPIISQQPFHSSELRQFELDDLIISDHAQIIFKEETQVPLKKFITLLKHLIADQRAKEGENEQYIYIKENLFIILIESLRICRNKKGKLDLEPFFEEFLQGQQKYLSSEMQYKIFSNPALCEKIRQYVKMEFKHNVPQGTQHIEFFQDCWLDFSHQKQREIDKQQSDRIDLTLFNQIYRWDKVYIKIIELIIGSNSLSNLNIKDAHQIQQSSFIQQNGLQEIKSQINQMSNKIKIKEIKIEQLPIKQIQHVNRVSQIQILSQMNDLQLDYEMNKKSVQFEEQILNQSQQNKEKKLVNKQKLIITDQFMKKKQKIPGILGKLIYTDIKNMLDQGIDLDDDLIQFYEKQDKCYKVKGYQCSKKQIFMLYGKQKGNVHIEKYLEEGYLINLLESDNHNLQQLERELNAFILKVR